ncbi:hypothetical protein AMS68_004370 [Peltaster fructicola]|uniref:Queuosine 5'-phosphate N-glycosylase/hydrolase n=1 Tax=Peltaster fructicola TaxID=286661 RepID=A0A6H0XVS9_9PEZI|nr:hypothetical protein AMS68_004370 [Peltaster fructicola]
MSDDEVDFELLELLRQRLSITTQVSDEISADTGVLADAEYIYNNAVDVSIDMWGTKSAAMRIWKTIQERGYSIAAWSEHEIHPKLGEELNEVEMANFVFTMDLLNFSFWSELSEEERFQIDYKGQRWTGYMSLVASLQRALSEGVPITTPRFWRSPLCTEDVIKRVFRGATAEHIPLLDERIAILYEAGDVLKEFDDVSDAVPVDGATLQDASDDVAITDRPTNVSNPDHERGLNSHAEESGGLSAVAETVASAVIDEDTSTPTEEGWVNLGAEVPSEPQTTQEQDLANFASSKDKSVVNLISKADKSAGKLVNLLVKHFSSFRDECRYEGRRVRLLKRAQIFVADLHAACNGQGIGAFRDIGNLTMFADYRVPQILHRFGVLSYCPSLEAQIHRKLPLEHRGSWEVQVRGCAIWATELLRREICRHPGTQSVNAVLIDFLLYDLAKELEFTKDSIPHHRTRSINY